MILAFDLDDTLYPEQSFVLSGFQHVAKFLSLSYNIPEGFLRLDFINEFYRSGRGKIFDSVLKSHGIWTKSLLEECVHKYQNHLPDICLYPGAKSVLAANNSVSKYLVTDGNPDTQLNKTKALGIREFFIEVIPTWSFGRSFAKPSLKVFDKILEKENASFEKLIYIGDDPSKDFVGLNSAGAITIRVLSGRFSGVLAESNFDAKFTIPDISHFELGQYL